MATSPIVDPAAAQRQRPSAGLPSAGLLKIDPILLLAVIGLGACSIMAIGETRFDGLVTRQALFFAVGLVLAMVISQIDYSRLRELKWGLYGLTLTLILALRVLAGVTRAPPPALPSRV